MVTNRALKQYKWRGGDNGQRQIIPDRNSVAKGRGLVARCGKKWNCKECPARARQAQSRCSPALEEHPGEQVDYLFTTRLRTCPVSKTKTKILVQRRRWKKKIGDLLEPSRLLTWSNWVLVTCYCLSPWHQFSRRVAQPSSCGKFRLRLRHNYL